MFQCFSFNCTSRISDGACDFSQMSFLSTISVNSDVCVLILQSRYVRICVVKNVGTYLSGWMSLDAD